MQNPPVSSIPFNNNVVEAGSIKVVLKDGLIMFAAWHSAFAQLLLNFYIPIIAAYTQVCQKGLVDSVSTVCVEERALVVDMCAGL